MRILAVERDTLNSEMAKHDSSIDPNTRAALAFRALADGSRSLDVLNRYDARFDRQFHRSLRLLLTAQNEPKAILPSHLVPKTDTSPCDRPPGLSLLASAKDIILPSPKVGLPALSPAAPAGCLSPAKPVPLH